MDFENLITELAPPPNRVGKHTGEYEQHLYEGAVMVAYATHLFRTQSIKEVRIHPDGEHGKRFDFAGWLGRRGFLKQTRTGTTTYAGVYTDQLQRTVDQSEVRPG